MKFRITFYSILLIFKFVSGQVSEGYHLKQLTNHPHIDSNPQWSPDGKNISFDSDINRSKQVYILNPDSNAISPLPIDSLIADFAVWVPGSDFLVATMHDGPNNLLVKYSLQSNDYLKLINRKIQSREASFNISGKIVAFIGKTETDQTWRLFTYDMKYDNLNNFTQPASDCHFPRWSPKGDYISYTTSQYPGSKKRIIQIINWYGANFKQITDSVLDLHDASWSPVRSKIAFVGTSADSSYLIVSHKDGTNREIIFKSELLLNAPCWSPNGKSIIFTMRINEQQQNIFQLISDWD
jgi:Tol biopolymer transport system component